MIINPLNRIRGVRSVDIGVTNLAAACHFYEHVWKLAPVLIEADRVLFRGTCGFHHILGVHRTPVAGILRMTLDLPDVAAVDAMHARVAQSGVAAEQPGPVALPGGGYGFACRDNEGRTLVFVANVADHAETHAVADRPVRITHVNLNAGDIATTMAFYTDVLQLTVIDEAVYFFLHGDSADHSCLIVNRTGGNTLNHVAFELPDLESVMRGAGRMRDAGYPIEWGVGRHGPADNVFAYFCGPEEFPIEYTAEVEQVGASYQPHGPDYWRFTPPRSDQWGVTQPRSARWARIQSLFTFLDGWSTVRAG